MTSEMKEKIAALRADLGQAQRDGLMDADLEPALWLCGRAIEGKAEYGETVELAIAVLRRLGVYALATLPVGEARTISKEEHDALLGEGVPKSVSREEYERMMREAQA